MATWSQLCPGQQSQKQALTPEQEKRKVTVRTGQTRKALSWGAPPRLLGLALTLVTMRGVWKSLPPEIRKPQGAGPTTSTVSAIPEAERMERWSWPAAPQGDAVKWRRGVCDRPLEQPVRG